MNIVKVKRAQYGLVVNDTLTVPEDEGNWHYQQVLKWVQDGGEIQPRFTEEEIQGHERIAFSNTRTQLLMRTDYLVLPDMQEKMTDDGKLAVLIYRQDLRDCTDTLVLPEPLDMETLWLD